MNVNVMVNACVLVNSATICFSPFIFNIPMPGQKFENKPNFSLQYSVPLYFTTTQKPATPAKKNSLVNRRKKPIFSKSTVDNNFWVNLNDRISVMQKNAKINVARFRSAVSNLVPGFPIWTMDTSKKSSAKVPQQKPLFVQNLPQYDY